MRPESTPSASVPGTTGSDDQTGRLRIRILTSADKASPDYARLLAEALEIQKMNVWRPDMTPREQERGFLLTTWSISELHSLMDEGAWMVVADDRDTGEMQGYGLISLNHHLPLGDFVPEEDSPIRTRAELADPTRFMYGYQIALRPARSLARLAIAAALYRFCEPEARRRKIHVVTCMIAAPLLNERGLGFFVSMGHKRIGTIYSPNGTSILPRPLEWACLVKWPLDERWSDEADEAEESAAPGSRACP